MNQERKNQKQIPYSSDVLKSYWLLFFHNLTKVSKRKLGRRDSMQKIRKYRTQCQHLKYIKYKKEKHKDKFHHWMLIICIH